jgi:hypothetical protein
MTEMYFEVAAELTARVSTSGTITLHRTRSDRPQGLWTGVRRELRVVVPLDVGRVVLTVYRGWVTVQGQNGSCTSTTEFYGPNRYLAAQRALCRLRIEACQRAEEQRQLARMCE